jgi:hypothetical protein
MRYCSHGVCFRDSRRRDRLGGAVAPRSIHPRMGTTWFRRQSTHWPPDVRLRVGDGGNRLLARPLSSQIGREKMLVKSPAFLASQFSGELK